MNNTIHIPHMATIKQAAAESGLAVYHVRQLVNSGKVVSVKAGTKFLVNMESLANYLTYGEGGESV